MAVRVAHARFKYDLQKTSKEDNRGTLFLISDTPNIRLIFTFRLPEMNRYTKSIVSLVVEDDSVTCGTHLI